MVDPISHLMSLSHCMQRRVVIRPYHSLLYHLLGSDENVLIITEIDGTKVELIS